MSTTVTRSPEELAENLRIAPEHAQLFLVEWLAVPIVERHADGRFRLTPAAVAAFAVPLANARHADPVELERRDVERLADELGDGQVHCLICGKLLSASPLCQHRVRQSL